MDREAFWKIIAASRKAAGGDDDRQMETMKAALLRLPAEEIVGFGDHYTALFLDAYRWDIWQAAYIAGGGCSDDTFMDFRHALIARGREVYEAVLEDPEYLAEILDDEGDELHIEGFGYVARDAWSEKTGRDPFEYPEGDHARTPEPAGDPCPEEDLPRRFPKLWERFGG